MIKQYGELYEGYNIGDKEMLIFWGADFFRKQLLCIVVTIYTDQLWLQIMIVFNQSIMMLVFAGYLRVRNSSYQ